jgi:lipopolysaccharide/colanic/teichoic acid biosynthesis glycosyltransferase
VYKNYCKPIADRLFASLLLALLSPIFLLCALIVRCTMGKPVFFRQDRPGRNGRIFTIYKFRTMNNAADAQGQPLSDERRLSAAGRLLRSLSLDELPQLINVLRGEMSFIGPRPLLIEYLPRYSPAQARRHLVKPGITGLAQINGRNALNWGERLYLDAFYAENLSFRLDARIFFLTLWKVFKREGISAAGEATMPPFLGNADRVFIYGGGDYAKAVADSAERIGLRVEGFIDGEGARSIAYGELRSRSRKERFAIALGVSESLLRRKIAKRLRADGHEIVRVIDPSADVSPTAYIGEGAVVLPQAVVGARARLEEGAIVCHGAAVEDRRVVGAYEQIGTDVSLPAC